MADLPRYPDMPRWAKVFGIVLAVLVLLIVAVMFIGGEHGPGRHAVSGGGPGGYASSEAGYG